MAAPTQEYPPWLTPIPSILFDASGVPLTTITSVMYLPLTYYGPSIPLNSDWTYGGLTPPASTSTVMEASSEPTMITTSLTATPSSLPPTIISPTATATPTSSSSVSLSTSLSSFSSLSLPSSTPSSITPVSQSHNLTRGQLIGVIIASILGFIFLFIIGLLLYLCCKGRRNRGEDPPFTFITRPDMRSNFDVAGRDGRTLGEGSPRHSGEEADPFLRQSGVPETPQSPDPEMGQRTSNVPPFAGIARVPVPDVSTGSKSSSGGDSATTSGYGSVIERPTLNLLPSTQEAFAQERHGRILTAEEIRQLDEETVLPSAEYSPLMPPPRLVDPEHSWTPPPDRPQVKSQSSQLSISAYPDADEAATLLTARRVRVEDLASRSPPQLPSPLEGHPSDSTGGGFLSSLGLGRLSWFKNFDSNSRRNSRAQSYLATPLTDEDVEAGKSLLRPDMAENQSHRRLGSLLGLEDRPISTVSGRSVGTVYHDAYSSLPGTPVSRDTPLAPPPRALTPSGQAGPQTAWPSSSTVAVAAPPAYDVPGTTTSQSTSLTRNSHSLPVGFDILDTPAPSAETYFTSTTPSIPSLRDTATGSSLGLATHPFPPGLENVPSKNWTDASSSATQATHRVLAPFSVLTSHGTNPGISIDVLEEAPPSAGEGWRSLAAEQGNVNARRTTFGQIIPPSDIASEEGSIYSMRSHLSPAPSRSTGSAPASRRDLNGSVGSGSSRPSAFSSARTGSSGHSLAHSGSISSDARRRGHNLSPTLSAFGGRRDASDQSDPPLSPLSPTLNAPPAAFTMPERAGGHRLLSSVDATSGLPSGISSPEPTRPTSPSFRLSNAPWAMGLDQNWTPT